MLTDLDGKIANHSTTLLDLIMEIVDLVSRNWGLGQGRSLGPRHFESGGQSQCLQNRMGISRGFSPDGIWVLLTNFHINFIGRSRLANPKRKFIRCSIISMERTPSNDVCSHIRQPILTLPICYTFIGSWTRSLDLSSSLHMRSSALTDRIDSMGNSPPRSENFRDLPHV